jgi:hypothetical protein
VLLLVEGADRKVSSIRWTLKLYRIISVEGRLPAHNYGVDFGGSFIVGTDDIPCGRSKTNTSNAGESKSRNNTSPYYSLFYVMKMK